MESSHYDLPPITNVNQPYLDMVQALQAVVAGCYRDSSEGVMPSWGGVTRDLLAHPVRGVRCGGSAGVDMMHVARGRLDAYFEALRVGRSDGLH